MSNDALLARFTVEHFDRNSIGAHRRAATLRVLSRVAAAVAPRTLDQLTPSDIMAWQASELSRGTKPNSLRNYESMLQAFVKWLHLAQLIDFELTMRLKSVPAVRGATAHLRPRPYKLAEIQVMREALSTHLPLIPQSGRGMYAVRQYKTGKRCAESRVHLSRHARRLQFEAQIALALECGLRCGEIHALTTARLHPDNECVLAITAKSKPGEVREREVPYTDHARLCVREWLAFRAILAPGHDVPWLQLGFRFGLEPQVAGTMLRSLTLFDRDTAPLRIRWHRLRHTFATERLRAGLPLEKLQVMMGHANLNQTLAYAEIVNADLVTEAERTADQFARNLGLAAA